VTIVGTGSGFGTELRREATVTIPADCSPPGTTIEVGPGDPTNDDAPAFRFSSSGGASGFECSVDRAAYESCSSPLTLPGLGEGRHRFSVRALDAAGNRDPSPATAAFTIDRSVDGAGLRVASSRLGPGGRRAGAVRVALGEPGTVALRATAVAGKRRLQLRRRSLELAAGDHARVRLVVHRSERRSLRRALRRGRDVEVAVRARFADALGNRAAAAVGFRLRR
jgi:hypothetical protein